jgi:hypothetical protein
MTDVSSKLFFFEDIVDVQPAYINSDDFRLDYLKRVAEDCKLLLANSIFYPAEPVDTSHLHNYKTHSSRLVWALVLFYMLHIHKNIDRHLPALFPVFCARSLGT